MIAVRILTLALGPLPPQPAIAETFSRAEVESLTDPANYLGAAPEMARAVLARR